MDEEELYFLEDDEDEFAPLEEELYPITLTRNEILFLDDSLTMLIEQEGYANAVTTMRMLSPSAHLPAPVSLIDKIGLAVLHVTNPETTQLTAVVHLDVTELYMLREICFSYSKVGREPVGYNLKRKFYSALLNDKYELDIKVDKLLTSIEPVEQKEG